MKAEEKIYKTFFESKESKLYYNQIREYTKLSHSSLQNALKKLKKANIITEEKTKSNTFYKIKDKKLIALKFSELAIKRFQELNIGIRVPLNNFLKGLPKTIHTIILFGSASRKQERKESDIDLLVVSEKPLNLDNNKKNTEVISNHHLSIFQCKINDFLQNKDHIIIQAKKTGFPIYKEQNFYEVILDVY
ncbi:MAG: nucleotidyltransferase domain-containing protein [Nanoarchaeota archaeon]|nr:nucleotidyltransferase domain-containing protein [Nanoarchaeota archaeon]